MLRLYCLLIVTFYCGLPGLVSAKEVLSIFVSIPPQKYLVERIGREHVDVGVMLKPGDSPETFDPGPKRLMRLASAQLYFRIGIPFENVWIDVIREGNKKIEVVECCNNILASSSTELDNHVWTSPRNALVIAKQIKKHLLINDPENGIQYEKNYQELVADLKQLDADIIKALSLRRIPYFIVSHASLGHYAKDYDLVQLSLEKDGKELGAKSLSKAVEVARQKDIQTLFVQKQHYSAGTDVFINELSAKVIEIDPLHEDYITNLRKLTGLIVEAVN